VQVLERNLQRRATIESPNGRAQDDETIANCYHGNDLHNAPAHVDDDANQITILE
jgi:hypothetical protein